MTGAKGKEGQGESPPTYGLPDIWGVTCSGRSAHTLYLSDVASEQKLVLLGMYVACNL